MSGMLIMFGVVYAFIGIAGYFQYRAHKAIDADRNAGAPDVRRERLLNGGVDAVEIDTDPAGGAL